MRELVEQGKRNTEIQIDSNINLSMNDTYQYCIDKFENNKEYRDLTIELRKRWGDIAEKCLKYNLCPITIMPKSVNGDIIGTPELLKSKIEQIEKYINDYEIVMKASQIYGKK